MGKWQKGYQMARIAIPHIRKTKTAFVRTKRSLQRNECRRTPAPRIFGIAKGMEVATNIILLLLAVVSLFRAFRNSND